MTALHLLKEIAYIIEHDGDFEVKETSSFLAAIDISKKVAFTYDMPNCRIMKRTYEMDSEWQSKETRLLIYDLEKDVNLPFNSEYIVDFFKMLDNLEER